MFTVLAEFFWGNVLFTIVTLSLFVWFRIGFAISNCIWGCCQIIFKTDTVTDWVSSLSPPNFSIVFSNVLTILFCSVILLLKLWVDGHKFLSHFSLKIQNFQGVFPSFAVSFCTSLTIGFLMLLYFIVSNIISWLH